MKIHWPKSLSAPNKEAYCGNPNWESLSSNSDNVSCRMCVGQMIRKLGYEGNSAANTYKRPTS